MLLTLPVELIQRVVRLTTPEEDTTRKYIYRQRSLRRFCLVSRRLRAVAQPILEEALLVKRVEDWMGAIGGSGRVIGTVRCMIASTRIAPHPDVLSFLAPQLVNLRDLRLFQASNVDVNGLARLQKADLRFLVLNHVHLAEMVLCVFHKVEELTSNDVASCSPSIDSFLTSSTFPALQALSYRRILRPHHIAALVDSSLYRQLHVFVVLNPQVDYGIPFQLIPPTCTVLGDFTWSDLQSNPTTASILTYAFETARLCVTDDEAGHPPDVLAFLQNLTASLARAQTSIFRLSLLYLPSKVEGRRYLQPAPPSPCPFQHPLLCLSFARSASRI